MTKIGIVIQARLGSTRFPKKVLYKIHNNKTLLEFLHERLKVSFDIPIVVATTNSQVDDELASFLSLKNIEYFRGDENDVLDRFVQCAKHFGFDHIIRICSDNPFIDVELLALLINTFEQNPGFDYYSYYVGNKPSILTHYGIFAELVNVSTLTAVNDILDVKHSDREHVTKYLYGGESNYKIVRLDSSSFITTYNDGIRLTVDTPEDMENIAFILNSASDPYSLDWAKIVSICLRNTKVHRSMKNQITQNSK